MRLISDNGKRKPPNNAYIFCKPCHFHPISKRIFQVNEVINHGSKEKYDCSKTIIQ